MEATTTTKKFKNLEPGNLVWTPFGYEAGVMDIAPVDAGNVKITFWVLRVAGEDVDYIETETLPKDSITTIRTGFAQAS